MTPLDTGPCEPQRRAAARYLEALVFLGLHLLMLPVYAACALLVWLLIGREQLGMLALVGALPLFWVVEVAILLGLLWAAPDRRESRRFQAWVDLISRVVASTLAWSVASGFSVGATIGGLLAGLAYDLGHRLHDRLTTARTEEERVADEERARDAARAAAIDLAERLRRPEA